MLSAKAKSLASTLIQAKTICLLPQARVESTSSELTLENWEALLKFLLMQTDVWLIHQACTLFSKYLHLQTKMLQTSWTILRATPTISALTKKTWQEIQFWCTKLEQVFQLLKFAQCLKFLKWPSHRMEGTWLLVQLAELLVFGQWVTICIRTLNRFSMLWSFKMTFGSIIPSFCLTTSSLTTKTNKRYSLLPILNSNKTQLLRQVIPLGL